MFAFCSTSWQLDPLESDRALETDPHPSLLYTVVRVTGKPPLDWGNGSKERRRVKKREGE